MKTVHKIPLDLVYPFYNCPLAFHQGDINSRELQITLMDKGQTVTITNSISAVADATVNGVITAQDEPLTVDTTNNVLKLTLTENMLSLDGVLKIDIKITENTELLTAATLSFRIQPSVINDESRFAPVLPTIEETIAQVGVNTAAIAAIETNKEDKSNKAARITSSNIGSGTNYPSIAAVAQYLGANYYKKNDIDDSTYTKSEVDTALAAKANTADVNTALAAKAEKSTVDSITENPDFFVLNSQTLGGVTVTNNGDGTYTFDSGGAVTDATVLFPSFPLPAGAYTAEIETLPGGSSEAYSGGGAALVAIKFGTGDGTTWVKADDDPASKTFAADTIIFFRLNRGTYNNLKLKISITKNNHITAVDSVARDTAGFTQEQLKVLSGKYSAQENAYYPLVEPDDFTWKNSPLHGKILTDFRDNYYVDFDVASRKNPIGKAYFVAPDGSDSNDGMPGTPFASISAAYNAGADTIYVKPGIYNRSTSIFNTAINRDLNIIGLGDGVILCTRVTNIPNSSEYSTGVWACSSRSTTYLSNVVDIKNLTADGHFTKYTKLTSKEAVQATAGSWTLVNNVAYIHTIDGNNPLAGDDVLLLYSPDPKYTYNQTTEKDILTTYPLIKVTGGKVYLENLTCLEGSAPLSVEKQQDGSNIEIYAKNCKFFYSRSALATKHNGQTEMIENDVCMIYGTALSIFQNCEASFSLKDGFGYHMGSNSSTPPKAIEINCIGIGNGNIEDGNDQGSTMHSGGSIIRVRDICAHNYGSNYADQGTGTESWNVGCVGFESWCSTTMNDQNADFFAYADTKMFLDGCVSFGSKHNFNNSSTGGAAGAFYLRNMEENVVNKVTSISNYSTDEQYPSAKAVYDGLNTKENTSNKVTSLSSSSTDNQYPSAKCVYDLIGNIETLLQGV